MDVVLPEESEVEVEGEQQQDGEEPLAGQQQAALAAAGAVLLHVALHGLEDGQPLGGDDVAAADDLLPQGHFAPGDDDGGDEVVLALFGAFDVAGEVGDEIVFDGALGEHVVEEADGVAGGDVGIGRAYGVDAAQGDDAGGVAVNQGDAGDGAVLPLGVVVAVHDAGGIDGLQPTGHVVGVFPRERAQAAVAVVGPEAGYLGVGRVVEGVVGVVEAHHAVALVAHHLVRLVYGEVVAGYDVAVAPRLVELVVVGERFGPRHEQYDDGREGQQQQGLEEEG